MSRPKKKAGRPMILRIRSVKGGVTVTDVYGRKTYTAKTMGIRVAGPFQCAYFGNKLRGTRGLVSVVQFGNGCVSLEGGELARMVSAPKVVLTINGVVTFEPGDPIERGEMQYAGEFDQDPNEVAILANIPRKRNDGNDGLNGASGATRPELRGLILELGSAPPVSSVPLQGE